MAGTGAAAEAVTAVAEAALNAPTGTDVAAVVLPELRSVIGADCAGYYVHEWRGWSTAVHLAPVEIWRIVPYTRIRTAVAAAAHPGVRRCIEVRSPTPFAVNDLISERDWWDSELHSRMRADWGRNYQFAIPVEPLVRHGESHVWVLGRTTSRFTDTDRDISTAVAPVLVAVARHRAEMVQLDFGADLTGVLTQREAAVLALHAEGATAANIARRLGMAPRTVHKHTEHIYRKLGVHSRLDAVHVCADLAIGRSPVQRVASTAGL